MRRLAPVPLVLAPWFTWPNSELPLVSGGNSSFAATANLTVYMPIPLGEACMVTKLWWQNGTTAAGNVDCGIYTENGIRLVSTGSTAQVGTSIVQSVDITDTVLPAGMVYFALVADSSSTTFWTGGGGGGTVTQSYTYSGYSQSGVFPLPATATFATTKSSNMQLRKYGALVFPRTVV